MKNNLIKFRTVLIVILLLLLTSNIWGDVLLGFTAPSYYSISKESRGIYRTPVSSKNIDLNYKETLNYLGMGFQFEAGFTPGRAGMRILPTLYSGQTEFAPIDDTGRDFSPAIYDLLGFTNEQSARLGTTEKPTKIRITESIIGTAFIFKYNLPTKFKANSKAMKIVQIVIATSGPWFGLGPMQMTFSRRIEAVGRDEFAKQNYTDFYFLYGGGFNVEVYKAWSAFPRNLIFTLEAIASVNLTPGNDSSTNDDNLNVDQGGLILNFGVGYRL